MFPTKVKKMLAAKPRAIRGVKKLMREKIRPHLEAMAPHIDAPLRLEIRLESEGCEPSPWFADGLGARCHSAR